MASNATDVQAPARATTDARLARAFDAIAAGTVSVLSLDVFDTMLWRRVPNAVDAFPILRTRLVERGLLHPEITPMAFKKQRIAAEGRARHLASIAGRGVEITLDEVYAIQYDSPEPHVEVEVELERELLVPDLDVLELVRFARERGKLVVAVSDTYFTELQLRSFLDPFYTLETQVDRVFASCEHGAGKTNGLFEIVLRELAREPTELIHVGDNEEADVDGARRAGIRGVHFERRPKELERILRREHAYLDDEKLRPQGDHGLTALRGKVLHRRELADLPEELRPFWRYGATALGPALTGFAAWIHDQTRIAGCDKAYCLMREGELISKLVNGAGAQLESDVTAEPMWLSRQVCARASIFEGIVPELRDLLTRRSAPTVRDLCATLRVDPAASPLLRRLADARLNEVALADEVFEELSSNPELRGPIVTEARLLRERVLDYLQQRVPGGAGNLVLVDLGWGATIQKYLHDILRRSDVPIQTIGLYLVTHDLATERVLDGVKIYGYLVHCGVPNAPARSIMRSPEVIEQVCMPDVGSQVDLTSDLEPVLSEPIDRALTQSAERGAVQSGILSFQREWGRYTHLEPGYSRLVQPDARELLLAQVARASVAPTAAEAAVFSTWIHDENYGSTGTDLMVGGERIGRAIRHMDPEDLIALPMSELYWPFGRAALEDEHLAAAADAVTMGLLPADAFRSTIETGDFEIYYDNGFGYGEGWKVSLESRRNRFGLSYARTTVRADEVRGVRVDPCKGPAVLRFDWLSLRCFARGREPAELMLDSPEAFERLTIRGASPLGPKLWMTGDDPQFELDLRAALGDGIYEVIVECAYALLPVAATREDPAAVELRRRTEARRRAVKRFVRQVENRTGMPVGEPLRKGWRRVRARLR
jgi:FMN phosphatase YigB (HAD superfamily)